MPDQATTPEQVLARIAEAGRRAKPEADARREKESPTKLPPELGGPKGPEPTPFGDWERKGIAWDF